MFERITFDPAGNGRPRVDSRDANDRNACPQSGSERMSTEDIIREYLELEAEDVRETLEYASALANEEIGFFKIPAA
jgi:uncharacterized protein (DUF433 family)